MYSCTLHLHVCFVSPFPPLHLHPPSPPMSETSLIVEHEGAIKELWEELKEMMDGRSMALAGAKEIHIFNKEAADTRSLIQVRLWEGWQHLGMELWDGMGRRGSVHWLCIASMFRVSILNSIYIACYF